MHFCKLRAKFESLCGSLFNNCIELVNDVLTSCQMNDASIDKVTFVVFNVVLLLSASLYLVSCFSAFEKNFPTNFQCPIKIM